MQANVSQILSALDAELVIYSEAEFNGNNDEATKQEERDYIENVLKKNNILFDGAGTITTPSGRAKFLGRLKRLVWRLETFRKWGTKVMQ